MKARLPLKVESGRVREGPWGSDSTDNLCGAFQIMGPCGAPLAIISSDGVDPEAMGWEHVSVSLRHRPPNWQEMSFVKDLFWEPDECVVQFHPPRSEYVNFHQNCLHLWKHKTQAFPLPASILVGPKETA